MNCPGFMVTTAAFHNCIWWGQAAALQGVCPPQRLDPCGGSRHTHLQAVSRSGAPIPAGVWCVGQGLMLCGEFGRACYHCARTTDSLHSQQQHTRISKMTRGSMYARRPSSAEPSSKYARANDTRAAASRICVRVRADSCSS